LETVNGLDFQICVEADFLVNIFEDAMEREAVKRVKTKHFSTAAGIGLLQGIYLR